jgi:hypothetical protein
VVQGNTTKANQLGDADIGKNDDQRPTAEIVLRLQGWHIASGSVSAAHVHGGCSDDGSNDRRRVQQRVWTTRVAQPAMQSSSDRSQQKADADCSFEYRCKPRFALATAWLSHAVGMHVLLRSRQMTGRNFITCEAEGNRGKIPGSRRYQAGWPRQRTRSGSGGTASWPGTARRLPR